jgi:hypothetical protein
MDKRLLIGALAVLLALNVLFYRQNHSLKSAVAFAGEIEKVDSVEIDGQMVDMRGVYTYPGIGAYFVPKDSLGRLLPSPLTLAVFFSSETTCPSSMMETAVFRRLLPVFRDRGQLIVAQSSRKDSAFVADLLKKDSLEIPLMVHSEDSGMTFMQCGISPRFMPFKVLYDSTYTAIYIRGADNTPESQAGFEDAALWLSEMISKR